MNKSAKGRRNEHKSRDLLLNEGYSLVLRSTGSFGPWDLIALHRALPIQLIQVKSNRKPPTLVSTDLYAPEWELRYHVWNDYSSFPGIYNARTGEIVIEERTDLTKLRF